MANTKNELHEIVDRLEGYQDHKEILVETAQRIGPGMWDLRVRFAEADQEPQEAVNDNQ